MELRISGTKPRDTCADLFEEMWGDLTTQIPKSNTNNGLNSGQAIYSKTPKMIMVRQPLLPAFSLKVTDFL
jgi:hypothetical protein